MTYAFTIFKSVYDVQTDNVVAFSDWLLFQKTLYDLHKKTGYKPAKGEKIDVTKTVSPLISPAVYPKGTTRANANVECWAKWACLDVDDYDKPFEEIVNSFGDFYYVCYSTASSTKEKPKFRLVFPLKQEVEADDIKHFWHALNSEFLGIGDAQTKDLSRMYYVPAQYPNAYNFIFTHVGEFIDPVELMEKYPWKDPSRQHGQSFLDKLPPGLREEVIKQRKEKLNKKYEWTSYRDCPFVNSKQVMEYSLIKDTGWYHKMFQIMVSIAFNAIKMEYHISSQEIAQLCREIDNDNGNWYASRPMEKEAQRALEFAYQRG